MGYPDDPDRDPLTGMSTSPDPVYYAYDNDGETIGSFGTRQEAIDAENTHAQDKLQELRNANIPSGFRPNFPSGPRAARGSSSGCLKTVIITIVVVVVIVVVVIVLLSLLGNYAANHINQHG